MKKLFKSISSKVSGIFHSKKESVKKVFIEDDYEAWLGV